MKVNNILKLSSLGLVSLGLVSTVALTTTSCGESFVNEITLTGEFKQGVISAPATADVKIENLVLLLANNVSTINVTNDASAATFLLETGRAPIAVTGEADEQTGENRYTVSIEADVEPKDYVLRGFYGVGTIQSAKTHMLTVKLTVTPADVDTDVE
jgi:hypothetical protein